MGRALWRFQFPMTKESRKKVWRVRDRKGNIAYFKFRLQKPWFKRDKSMIANEFIAISLARKLGLPVARLSRAIIKGRSKRPVKGYISRQVNANEVITWKKACDDVKANPQRYINDTHLLARTIVFDVWILNKDRTDVNLILYRDYPWEKYSWYLIDFGSSLLGSRSNSTYKRIKKRRHPQLRKPLR
ncbi:HipA family kinase [Brevibacillus migulae]|uniref:HipA family kinase n=1 Tax=Brevibacillus migulae TaxID=1644114 RepID=UPI00106DFF75|nr:HipA family kinase [Brevibacillus migulae]